MRVLELGGQLAHELAEIDAAVGREVEHEPRAVERLLDARQLHAEAALADLQQRDAVRLALALLLLQPRDDVVVRRERTTRCGESGAGGAARRAAGCARHDGADRRYRRRSGRRPGIAGARRRASAAADRRRRRSAPGRPAISLTETSRTRRWAAFTAAAPASRPRS